MVSRFSKVLAGVAAATLLLAGCSGQSEVPADTDGATDANTEPYLVYYSYPATGPLSGTATAVREAAELAVKSVNESGGVLGRQMELIFADDKVDTQLALTLLEEQIDKKKPDYAFIGNTSNIGLALAPITSREGILSGGVLGSSALNNPEEFPYNFIPYIESKNDGEAMGNELESRGAKKVGIIHASDANGQSTFESMDVALKERGIELVAESYAPTDTDLTAQLERLRAQNVDNLLFHGFGAIAGVFMKDRTKVGWDVPTIGLVSLGVGSNLALISQPSDWVNLDLALHPISVGISENQDTFEQFREDLRAAGSKLDQPMHYYTVYWDVLHLIQKAAEQAQSTDVDDMKAAFENMQPNAELDKNLLSWPTANMGWSADNRFLDVPVEDAVIVRPAGPIVDGLVVPVA